MAMGKINGIVNSRLCGNDNLNPSAESGFNEIILYQPEGEIRLEVHVEKDTVWLTQAQMAELFKRERSVIAKHIGIQRTSLQNSRSRNIAQQAIP
jgi:hypothetical protein